MKRNAFFSAEQMVAALTSAPDTAVQDASNPGTHAADWDNAIVSHSLGELLFLGLSINSAGAPRGESAALNSTSVSTTTRAKSACTADQLSSDNNAASFSSVKPAAVAYSALSRIVLRKRSA